MNFHLRFVMSSDPRLLCVVRAAIGELGSVFGLPDEDCREMTLAVDEALANIIRHAYKSRLDQQIELNCRARADRLEFTIFDRGEPADPSRICAQPLDAVTLSGRGTHLIKLVMDEVCYEQVLGGNQLRLSKHLPPANTSSTSDQRLGSAGDEGQAPDEG